MLFVLCSIGIVQLLYLVNKTDVVHHQCQCQCMLLSGHKLCMVNFAELCARGPKQTWRKCRSRLWASQALSTTKSPGPETPKPSFVVGQVLGFCWSRRAPGIPIPNSKLPPWRLLPSVRSPPSRAAFATSRPMPSQLLSIAS